MSLQDDSDDYDYDDMSDYESVDGYANANPEGSAEDGSDALVGVDPSRLIDDALDLMENKKSGTVMNGLASMVRMLHRLEFIEACRERPVTILGSLMGVVKMDKEPQSLHALDATAVFLCQLGGDSECQLSDRDREVLLRIVRNNRSVGLRVAAARVLAVAYQMEDVEDDAIVEFITELFVVLRKLGGSASEEKVELLLKTIAVSLPLLPSDRRQEATILPMLKDLEGLLSHSSVLVKVAACRAMLLLLSIVRSEPVYAGPREAMRSAIQSQSSESQRRLSTTNRRRTRKKFAFMKRFLQAPPEREVSVKFERTSSLTLSLRSWVDVTLYEYVGGVVKNGMQAHLQLPSSLLCLRFASQIVRSSDADQRSPADRSKQKKVRSYDADRRMKEKERQNYMNAAVYE